MTRRFNSRELDDGILPYQPREGCRGVVLIALLTLLITPVLISVTVAAMMV